MKKYCPNMADSTSSSSTCSLPFSEEETSSEAPTTDLEEQADYKFSRCAEWTSEVDAVGGAEQQGRPALGDGSDGGERRNVTMTKLVIRNLFEAIENMAREQGQRASDDNVVMGRPQPSCNQVEEGSVFVVPTTQVGCRRRHIIPGMEQYLDSDDEDEEDLPEQLNMTDNDNNGPNPSTLLTVEVVGCSQGVRHLNIPQQRQPEKLSTMKKCTDGISIRLPWIRGSSK